MRKKALCAGALCAFMVGAQAGPLLQENFETDLSQLVSKQGWALVNKSSNPGNPWVFGSDLLPGQSGVGYAAANYTSTKNFTETSTEQISNWLITPTVSLAKSGSISFWLRTDMVDGYKDSLDLRLSRSGGSADTGAFATLLTSIDATQAMVDDWVSYTVFFDGLGGGATGRFAFVYRGLGATANFLALDSVTVNVPEPTGLALTGIGLLAVLGVARRRRAV